MQQVQVRALRNVGLGFGRDLRAGECGAVDAHTAAVLCEMSATELVDANDAEALVAAGRAEVAKQASDATRDRWATPIRF